MADNQHNTTAAYHPIVPINWSECAEPWQPTMSLRWRTPPRTTTAPSVLEQAWVNASGLVRWRAVPLVAVEPDS